MQIILFTQNFSIIFPLTEDSQVENHWPGKIRIVRIGIITKRRIKLHDILLLSRFPLIKQPAFPSLLVPVCARVNASRYHFSSLRHVPFRLAFRSLDEYTHPAVCVCIDFDSSFDLFIYVYISSTFPPSRYIFNTTLVIHVAGAIHDSSFGRRVYTDQPCCTAG